MTYIIDTNTNISSHSSSSSSSSTSLSSYSLNTKKKKKNVTFDPNVKIYEYVHETHVKAYERTPDDDDDDVYTFAREVKIPIPTCERDVKTIGFNRSVRVRRRYVNPLLNPVQNLAQWKLLKAKCERDNFVFAEEFENPIPIFSSAARDRSFKEVSESNTL